MKRLILLIVAVLLALTFTQTSFAQQMQCKASPSNGYHANTNCGGTSSGGTVHAVTAQELNGNMFQHFANRKAFLPGDIRYATHDTVGRNCDENGFYRDSGKGRCVAYMSQSTGKHYLISGARIFTVENGKPDKYVEFDGSSTRVAYQSPAARQFAEASGYRFDNDTRTMVAMNAPAASPEKPMDCSETVTVVNVGKRAGCVNGQGTKQASTVPATVATAPPSPVNCSQMSGFAKIKCEGAAALGGAAPAIGGILGK